MTHIDLGVGDLTIISSDNGLSPGRRQAIISTNAGILSIGPLRTNFSEILIGVQTFSFKKLHLKRRLQIGVYFVSASMSLAVKGDMGGWLGITIMVVCADPCVNTQSGGWNIPVSEWVIKFNGLSGDSGQWSPHSPYYKPSNHSLYIGIIIFPHIDNTIYRPQLTLRKRELKKEQQKREGTH